MHGHSPPRFAEPADAMRRAFAGTDPEDAAADPFELFLLERVRPHEVDGPTPDGYRRAFARWRAHMNAAGRPPARPELADVRAFAAGLEPPPTGDPDGPDRTLRALARAYRFFQEEAVLPHGEGANPFLLAAGEG